MTRGQKFDWCCNWQLNAARQKSFADRIVPIICVKSVGDVQHSFNHVVEMNMYCPCNNTAPNSRARNALATDPISSKLCVDEKATTSLWSAMTKTIKWIRLIFLYFCITNHATPAVLFGKTARLIKIGIVFAQHRFHHQKWEPNVEKDTNVQKVPCSEEIFIYQWLTSVFESSLYKDSVDIFSYCLGEISIMVSGRPLISTL